MIPRANDDPFPPAAPPIEDVIAAAHQRRMQHLFVFAGCVTVLLAALAGVLVAFTADNDSSDSLAVTSSPPTQSPTEADLETPSPPNRFGDSLAHLTSHFGERFVGSAIRSESELDVYVVQLSTADMEWLTAQDPDLTEGVSLHEMPADLPTISQAVDGAAAHLRSAGVGQFAVSYSLDPLEVKVSLPEQANESDRAAAEELPSVVPLPVSIAFDLVEARFDGPKR